MLRRTRCETVQRYNGNRPSSDDFIKHAYHWLYWFSHYVLTSRVKNMKDCMLQRSITSYLLRCNIFLTVFQLFFMYWHRSILSTLRWAIPVRSIRSISLTSVAGFVLWPWYFPEIVNFIGYCPVQNIYSQTKHYLNRAYRNDSYLFRVPCSVLRVHNISLEIVSGS